jgi:hypothetical protein
MRIQFNPSPIFQARWYEYAIRFVLGGIITVAAGLIADRWVPGIGGLFLAFPAIFPASATLIEKHEKEAKQAKGLHGTLRARSAAAIDAAGSSIGSIGLLGFALLVAALLPHHSPVAVLLLGLTTWAVVSVICWRLRKAM